jgi:hypothetical protein
MEQIGSIGTNLLVSGTDFRISDTFVFCAGTGLGAARNILSKTWNT